MNWRRPRSWKHTVEGENINHADSSVCRSQPESLIIHTYTQKQGGSPRAMITSKQPSPPRGSPQSSQWLMHTHACGLGEDLFQLSAGPIVQQVKEQGAGEQRPYGVEWGENKSHSPPASMTWKSETKGQGRVGDQMYARYRENGGAKQKEGRNTGM